MRNHIKDIRFYPWTISTLNGMPTRVHEYNGYKCGLTKIIPCYPHAAIRYWTVVEPNGAIHPNIDLEEANKIIFN